MSAANRPVNAYRYRANEKELHPLAAGPKSDNSAVPLKDTSNVLRHL
jgi:hypothetical protein